MGKRSQRKTVGNRAGSKSHTSRKKLRKTRTKLQTVGTSCALTETKEACLSPLKEITMKTCARCGAKLLSTDSPSICCGMGLAKQYGLIDLPSLPSDYVDLYRTSMDFCRKSRAYNNLLALSALGTTGEFLRQPGGPSSITLHGRTYHRMLNGTVDERELQIRCRKTGNDKRGPLRWFVSDASAPWEDAEQHKLDPETVERLCGCLSKDNYFWDRFKHFSEMPSESIRLELTVSSNREVAALICENDSGDPEPRAVVCWKKTSNAPTFIKTTSALYLPLQYVLLYPCGTLGWDISMKQSHNLTLLKYCRQLMLRHEPFEYLGQLFKEFAVDCFSIIEDLRLEYLHFNQHRICPRQELKESIAHEDNAGRSYLPSSHVHSPRYMREQTADALAIVARFGKPTFFITVTCNPKWPEILVTCHLKPGQDASDRPDIVVRVFKAKLQEIFNDLTKALNGDKIVYRIQVIEFQKRGLPHAHIAVKMSREPLTAEEIDEVIQAEVPRDDGELRKIVEKHMRHGHVKERCFRQKGHVNIPDAEGNLKHPTCVYYYPKSRSERTHTDESGYKVYRRRTDDDLMIVSYNPALLRNELRVMIQSNNGIHDYSKHENGTYTQHRVGRLTFVDSTGSCNAALFDNVIEHHDYGSLKAGDALKLLNASTAPPVRAGITNRDNRFSAVYHSNIRVDTSTLIERLTDWEPELPHYVSLKEALNYMGTSIPFNILAIVEDVSTFDSGTATKTMSLRDNTTDDNLILTVPKEFTFPITNETCFGRIIFIANVSKHSSGFTMTPRQSYYWFTRQDVGQPIYDHFRAQGFTEISAMNFIPIVGQPLPIGGGNEQPAAKLKRSAKKPAAKKPVIRKPQKSAAHTSETESENEQCIAERIKPAKRSAQTPKRRRNVSPLKEPTPSSADELESSTSEDASSASEEASSESEQSEPKPRRTTRKIIKKRC